MCAVWTRWRSLTSGRSAAVIEVKWSEIFCGIPCTKFERMNVELRGYRGLLSRPAAMRASTPKRDAMRQRCVTSWKLATTSSDPEHQLMRLGSTRWHPTVHVSFVEGKKNKEHSVLGTEPRRPTGSSIKVGLATAYLSATLYLTSQSPPCHNTPATKRKTCSDEDHGVPGDDGG